MEEANNRRPYYESATDLRKQERIRERIEAFSGRKLVGPLKRPWRHDYFATRKNRKGEDTITSLIEVKCRSHDKKDYPTLLISWSKIHVCLNLSDRIGSFDYDRHTNSVVSVGCNFILCVGFGSQSIEWVQITRDLIKNHCKILMGGRCDRNDPHDYERVLHIPVELFQPLETLRKSRTPTFS